MMSKTISKTLSNSISHNTMLGIAYMLLHVVALAALYAAVKGLTKGIEPGLVVFLYKVAILICIFPWCFYNGFAAMKTNRIGLHAMRACFSVFAQICMFYGLKNLGLSDVTAVQYLEYVIVLIIGILYFKEKATKTKFAAITISFLGALVITFPHLISFDTPVSQSFEGFNANFIFVFAALILYAINNTAVKVLGRTEKTKVQLFYVTLFSSMLAFPIALMKWHNVGHLGIVQISYPYGLLDIGELGLNVEHFWGIMFLAFCYFIHSICHFQAFKLAEISTVIPLEYTRLIFAAIFGYVFLDDAMPSTHKLAGYILITGAGLFLMYSERRRYKRAKQKLALQDEFEQ